MRKITTLLSLLLLASNLSAVSGLYGQQADRQTQIEVWKQQVSQRGTGERSKWEAQLLDGRKIRGYVSQLQQEGFTLVAEKTGETVDLKYAELEALKPRTGMSKGAKIALFAGVAAGVILAAGAIAVNSQTH